MDTDSVATLLLPSIRLTRSLSRTLIGGYRSLRRLRRSDALVLTMPGVVGSLALLHARLHRRRFAVQVVGDPHAVAFQAGVGGRPGRAAGLVLAAAQRYACRHAVVTAYVSDAHLQARYPPGRATATHRFPNAYVTPVRAEDARGHASQPQRLLTVASLEQTYKRVDLCIDALAQLRAEGWDLHLDVVGSGSQRGALEERAARLGIAASVTFHGQVPRRTVTDFLARADLFLLCSDTDGMPRALIEALAVGLPCIGSDVGGIAELLSPAGCFRAGSVDSLVGAIRRHLVSPQLRERRAAEALRRASDFTPDQVLSARERFLEAFVRAGRGS